MSYAGKESRTYRGAAATAGRIRAEAGGRSPGRERSLGSRALGRSAVAPPQIEVDWQHVTIFAAGALLGASLGAGAALLFAPQSGEETRYRLTRRGRRFRERTADAWGDLRDELQYAARRGRRKLGRALRRRRQNRERHADDALDD
jgi:gas vesicle protein